MFKRTSPNVKAVHSRGLKHDHTRLKQALWTAPTTPLSTHGPSSTRSGTQFPIKNRHLVWFLLALVLTHLSQLSAKNDDTLVTWEPPLEPPGSVVVTYKTDPTPAQKTSNLSQPRLVVSANSADKAADTPHQAQATEDGLRLALAQWSRAWSQQDMAQYLSMYGDNFKAPNGISREAWARQRTQRITSKKQIEHSITNLAIDLRAVTATVRFTQNYQDERLKLTDRKTMFWAFKDGRWQITLETTN